MESLDAIDGFAALAQPTRLAVVKLLVRAGAEGLPSGEIARIVDAPASTMSTHLAILTRAGLVSSRRDSRLIYYAADMAGISTLISYLVEDCCEGHPEICSPIADILARANCCVPAPQSVSTRSKKNTPA